MHHVHMFAFASLVVLALVLVVEWFTILKQKLLLERLTLAKHCRQFSSVKCVYFLKRPTEPASYHCKTGVSPKWVVGFLLRKRHIPETTWKS